MGVKEEFLERATRTFEEQRTETGRYEVGFDQEYDVEVMQHVLLARFLEPRTGKFYYYYERFTDEGLRYGNRETTTTVAET